MRARHRHAALLGCLRCPLLASTACACCPLPFWLPVRVDGVVLQRRRSWRQRAQRAAVAIGRAALEDTPDASATRPGSGAGRRALDPGWLEADAVNANPKKTRNIRILYAPELVDLRRGLRRRIKQRGRGRRRLHGRRESIQSVGEVVARHVERVPQRLEDGELDG